MDFTLKTLDQIGIEQQTDKASQFSRTYAKPHDYLRHLEKFFAPWRGKPIKFLEIGVGGGESIRTWLEYLPHAVVFGIDNFQGSNPWNTVSKDATPHDRYKFVAGDQSDPNFWAQFVADYPIEWDVFLDDGGHASNQVITTFNCMWPHVKSGGLFIIEDLATAYSPIFLPAGWESHMNMLKSKLDSMHAGQSDIESAHFFKELCILRKV